MEGQEKQQYQGKGGGRLQDLQLEVDIRQNHEDQVEGRSHCG
jgi:hypothetical protein